MEGDRLPRIARRALKMRTPDIFRPALKEYPVLRKGLSRYYAPLTLAPAEVFILFVTPGDLLRP